MSSPAFALQRPVGHHKLVQRFTMLLCIFLVLAPKGGIKAIGLPFTWGYLLLILSFFLCLPARLSLYRLFYTRRLLITLITVLSFLPPFFYAASANGVTNPSFFVSTFTSFVGLPFLFLIFYPPFLRLIDGRRFAKILAFCILGAAIYGIFTFALRPLTGKHFDVPYLTSNASDGDAETTKNNDRGGAFKLISTYNNGNIYGVCTFILLPLFDRLVSQRWKRLTVRVAIVLTLSRSVWAGLFFEQILSIGATLVEQIRSFPRIRGNAIFARVLLLVACAIAIGFTLAWLNRDSSFLFDSQLGGRAGSLAAFSAITFLPMGSVDAFSEILYASATARYGLMGLLAIIAIFFGPWLVLLADLRVLSDPYRRAGMKGLVLYSLLCFGDSAISFLPVMAFYWFAYMIFLFGFPGHLAPDTLGPRRSLLRSPAQIRVAPANGLTS